MADCKFWLFNSCKVYSKLPDILNIAYSCLTCKINFVKEQSSSLPPNSCTSSDHTYQQGQAWWSCDETLPGCHVWC